VPPPGPESAKPPGSRRIYVFAAAALLIVIGAVVAVIALSSSSSPTAPKPDFAAAVRPVPTNRVTGRGTASVTLQGNVATVTVNTTGLLNAVHLMHIHGGGRGLCPTASAARPFNGHRFISTTDGLKFYGGVVEALTQTGGTSPSSFLAFTRYPSGSAIRYKRTFTLQRGVARLIRDGNAVVVVHGIDYDHSGVYDDFLGRSELTRSLTADATAPALCGTLRSSTSSPVPFGAVMADARRDRPSPGTVYTASLTISVPPRSASALGAGMALYCGAGESVQ
jgi:hypothetical protein